MRSLEELVALRQVDRHRHGREHLLRLGRGHLERLRNHRRVDALFEQARALVEHRAAEHDDGRRAVARLDVLRLGQLDEHLGRRVKHLHVRHDRRAVVRDDDFAVFALRRAKAAACCRE